jgi:hypothetical protein
MINRLAETPSDHIRDSYQSEMRTGQDLTPDNSYKFELAPWKSRFNGMRVLFLVCGLQTNAHIQCGFHAWKFQLSDGKFVSAPYTKKSPNCGLVGYKAFVEQGMIFVYTGDEEYFETAKGYTIGNVLEDQISVHIEYEVPFYLALSSGIDYAHFPFHTFFFKSTVFIDGYHLIKTQCLPRTPPLWWKKLTPILNM